MGLDHETRELIRCLAVQHAIYEEASEKSVSMSNDADCTDRRDIRRALVAASREYAEMSGATRGAVYKIALQLAGEGY